MGSVQVVLMRLSVVDSEVTVAHVDTVYLFIVKNACTRYKISTVNRRTRKFSKADKPAR